MGRRCVMNEAAKNSKNRYQMNYHIQVPVSKGLKPLFQQIEEIRHEFGIEPSDDYFLVTHPETCKKGQRYHIVALIDYSRTDALKVLDDRMSEEEYIVHNISSSTDADGKVLTHEDGGLDDFAVEDIF